MPDDETKTGSRITCEDLETGDAQTMIVQAGDYMLIPLAPCYLDSFQRHANGTVQLTIKGHSPQGSAVTESATTGSDAR